MNLSVLIEQTTVYFLLEFVTFFSGTQRFVKQAFMLTCLDMLFFKLVLIAYNLVQKQHSLIISLLFLNFLNR